MGKEKGIKRCTQMYQENICFVTAVLWTVNRILKMKQNFVYLLFHLLVSKTRIDEAALQAELLKAVRSRVEREFMLKRQLVGFFLLQGLAQLDRFLKRNTLAFEAIMI